MVTAAMRYCSAQSRLREHSPSWQEEIIITREGPIESDGTYGRLAMEEQAREKKEKERQKEAERNSTDTQVACPCMACMRSVQAASRWAGG